VHVLFATTNVWFTHLKTDNKSYIRKWFQVPLTHKWVDDQVLVQGEGFVSVRDHQGDQGVARTGKQDAEWRPRMPGPRHANLAHLQADSQHALQEV